jgi:peptidoglycan hydrolase-like protein with peptidoglycan-binding domain
MLISLATGYFGQITSNALAKYKADVLAKINLSSCPVGLKCVAQNPNVIAPSIIKLPQFINRLELGSYGSDVANLQRFLNSKGFIVSNTGAGSLGNESQFFGPATKNALTQYQNTNSVEIIKTKLLLEGNGVFDEATRIYINNLIK